MARSRFFCASYAQARARFRDLAGRAGARVGSHVLAGVPAIGRDLLTTDIAWLGPGAPRGALVVTSGTHGVEGHAGSGFQCHLLDQPGLLRDLDEIALVLVHAVNPFGFAHGRRVNENNVDLNRNFIDFAQPLPGCPQYDRLHDAIVPEEWTGDARDRADAVLAQAWDTLGERGFQNAVCHGQYTHEDGLFYGGTAPSWSHTTWRNWLAKLPASVELLAHIDVHTGLGPKGYGEILYTLPRAVPAFALAGKWYGKLDLQAAGTAGSSATGIKGTMNHAVITTATVAEATSISIEFGTVEFPRMFEALRADNWYHARGAGTHPGARLAREELKSCFYPQDPAWRDMVLGRCDETLIATLEGMREHLATTGRA